MEQEARVIEHNPVAVQQPSAPVAVTPMTMLQIAIDKGADLDKLQQLMDLQERWEKNEAHKAFNVAFAAFKAESVEIIKRTEVKDGPLKGRFHANLFDVVSGVTPALSKHGLTISWKLSKDDKDWMAVTCTLSHAAGHAETVSMGGAPDTGPGRNAIQARGSAKSYLERYTATAILGLAAKDADDDAQAAGGAETKPTLTETQVADFLANIEAASTKEELKTAYLAAGKAAEALADEGSMAKFRAAKEARVAALKKAA